MAKKTEKAVLEDRIRELEEEVASCKGIEDALRESEEKFSRLFHYSNDGIFMHDLEGNILDVNQRVLELLGYSASEIKVKKIHMLHPEESLTASEQAFKTIMEKGYVRFEINFLKNNGDIFPAEVSARMFKLGDKDVIQGIVRDITLRKKVEKTVRESEEKLRAMFNASPLSIVLLDREGRVLDSNDGIAARLETTRSQLVGSCIWDYFSESVRARRKIQSETVFDTGEPITAEDERDGLWSEFHIYPAIKSAGGRVKAILVEVMDITERKNSMTALQESENRYKSLFKNNHTVMLLIDPDTGSIVDANPAAIAYYGWSHEEIIGKKISEINTLSEALTNAEMEQASLEMRKYFNFQHKLASGEVRDVEVYSGPIVIFGKRLLYSIIHDITDRKRAEEERNRLIKDLERALKEIKTLRGILPICSFCKKVRDDKGYWERVDVYVQKHSQADFSHGICPDCAKKHYPDYKIEGLK